MRLDKITLTFMLMFNMAYSYGQSMQRDTVYLEEKYMITFIHPGDYRAKTFNYEEGYFYDLLVYGDNALISFHCGALHYEKPDETAIVISDFRINGVLQDTKWKYMDNDTCYYKRVISIFPYNINFVYDKVVYDNILKYDQIFNNIYLSTPK